MIKSLIRKEFQQHLIPFLGIILLTIFLYLILINSSFLSFDEANELKILKFFVLVLIPLQAFVLGLLLITNEYLAKTQLFLETLPISRLYMFLTKYTFGLFIILATVTLLSILSFIFLFEDIVFDSKYVLILLSRVLIFSFSVYALSVFISFLGRYRIPLFLFTVIMFFGLKDLVELDLSEFGPLGLLGSKFEFERNIFPWIEIVESVYLIVFFNAISIFFVLSREGFIAFALSKKMSQREKVYIAVILISYLFIFSSLKPAPELPPYSFMDGDSIKGKYSQVEYYNFEDDSLKKKKKLANFLVENLDSLASFFNYKNLPKLFISERHNLEAKEYINGAINKTSGILYRINSSHPDFNRSHFLSKIIHQILVDKTNGRAALERNHWLLDGFAMYWAFRNQSNSVLWLQSKFLTKHYPIKNVNNWTNFARSMGGELSDALAWSLIKTLQSIKNNSNFKLFITSALKLDVPKDIRAGFFYSEFYSDNLLKKYFSIDQIKLLDRMRTKVNQRHTTNSIDSLWFPKVTLIQTGSNSAQKELVLTFEDHNAAPALLKIEYGKLEKLSSILSKENTFSIIKSNISINNYTLPKSFMKNDRVAYLVSYYSDDLKCDIVSGWKEIELTVE